MRFIDKINTAQARRGEVETQSIMDRHWNGTQYLNLSYDLCDKTELRHILLEEQRDGQKGPYCCYCMRRLYSASVNYHNQNVTLEHIIPNKITANEWDGDKEKYCKFPNLSDRYIFICFEGVLQNGNGKIAGKPHPHFISNYNLVASCNGTVFTQNTVFANHCCNEKRGNQFVKPFYLEKSVSEEIVYDKKGNILCDSADFESRWLGTDCLNLSCHGLMMVRRFWYKISISSYSVQDIEKAEMDANLRNDIIDDIVDLTDRQDSTWEFFRKQEPWCWLSEYSWFYDYYSCH